MSAPKNSCHLLKLMVALGCSSLLLACSAGSSVTSASSNSPPSSSETQMFLDSIETHVSAPAATVSQVHSISPVNGETNIGISSPIVVKFALALESAGINATLIEVKNQNSYNVPYTISDGGTIYTFTPPKKLKPNSTYRFVLSKDGYQLSSTFTTQVMYKIFLTTGDYKGNLRANNLNASSGADTICNTDSGNPDISQYYKAMLSVVAERYACSSENVCGGVNSLNWVLQPGLSYYNTNSELIASTTSQAIFNFPLNVAFGLGSSNHVWTGLTNSWGSVAGGDSCKAWTSSSSDNRGRCGRSAQVDPGAISNDKQDCNGWRKLYCVMQPNAVLVTPIARSTTSNYATPISVLLNVVGGVNASTVTTSSFTVSESSTDVIGHSIAGKITSADSITYTFTPSSPLLPGKTYIVNLSSSISSNNGTPITPATLSFFTATESKLIYLTSDQWWGDLLQAAKKAGSTATTGVTGADYLCQIDTQCPAGKTCKAIISDALHRVACVDNPNDPESAIKLCGANYSSDWVLTPNTSYVNTNGAVIGTSNSAGIFDFLLGFQFSSAISSGGKAWTGLLPDWTSQKNITCEHWTIGDSGVNQLAGMIAYSDQINYKSICAGSGHAGGCSQYNKEDAFGKYCYTEKDGKKMLDGCSKRGLYCAVQ